MATTVTLKRPHFETLLRRAELHSPHGDDSSHVPTIAIPKAEYHKLLLVAQDFANLKESLYKGGISEETLEILIHGEGNAQPDGQYSSRTPLNGQSALATPYSTADDSLIGRDEFDSHASHQNTPSKLWADEPYQSSSRLCPDVTSRPGPFRDEGCFTPDLDREDTSVAASRADRTFYARNEQRTLLLKGLPELITHEEIVKTLRGGLILDVFLRANDRSASVSFVEGSSAQQFLMHVRRNDLYIGGKRIEVQWNDRQFILPGHVASKIGIGATRNLVLRSVPPTVTETGIREDLDHIHNLVVVGIGIRDGDMHIELNSIHNALFARTCMMSRSKYKGLKIEWSADECAQALPVAQHPTKKVARRQTAPLKPIAPPNRFQMLDMDVTEDGSSDEEEDRTETTLSDLANLKLDSRYRRAVAT